MGKLGKIAMLGAAMASALTPVAVHGSRTASRTVTVQQQSKAAQGQQQGAMQSQRTGQGTQQAIGGGVGGLYRGLMMRPFAPWNAPLYNQRKARRRARQNGRKVK